MKFKRGAAIIAAVAALSLTACAGGSAPETAPEEETTTTEEVISLNVSVLPIAATAPVQIAIDEGIFEKHGLDVEVSNITTGSAGVPSVLNGSVDISYGNLISTIQAAAEGLPIVSVVSSDGAPVDPEQDINWLMVRADSGIETAQDLAGKTVAVNGLNGLVYLVTRASIDELGGDSASVEYVEIPFPEMLAALEAGRVDAISTTEPFRTIGLANPENIAIIPTVTIGGTRGGQIVDTYFTSEKFLQENEEAVTRFRAAMYEAQTLANENPDVVRSAISNFLEMPEAILAEMHLALWATEAISEADFDFMAGLMVRYGLLTEDELPSYGDLIRE